MFFNEKAGTQELGVPASHNNDTAPERQAPQVVTSTVAPTEQDHVFFPPGLIGEVANYILASAQHQSPTIALAGAIMLVSGICGRAYCTYTNAGLNQYILVLAKTGMGKEAIADAVGLLMTEVKRHVEGAKSFQGPGELVSSAGLIKWLAKNPAIYSILGEFGVKLKEMADRKANAHLAGLERILLQLYSKSRYGNTLDPMAYSDTEKNTAAIPNPAFTMLGETSPERFYEMLDDTMISSGLLARFMTFEERGKRPYAQECPQVEPSPGLVERLSQVAANCLAIPGRPVGVLVVPATPEAQEHFRLFERFTTDQINGAGMEVTRQLWNRARLKALKLATACAVGINPFDPIVTINEAWWATHLIARQTNALIAKFDTGEVGKSATDEDRQVAELIKAITLYANCDLAKIEPYGPINEDMHRAKVFTKSFLYRYLTKRAAFKNDRAGPKAALERSLKTLTDSDEIREVPNKQLVDTFGASPKAYCIANMTRFFEPTT